MVEYKLRDSKRGWYNTRSLYSDEGALEAPSRNNAIIENDLDLVLSSTVNRKLEVHQECDPFLKEQGKGSILTDAFNHWFQGEKEYNIKPDKYWWHHLLQKIDNHLLQFVTNGNTGYSYLAAQATVDVLNKLYKEYAHRFEKTYNWDFPYTVYNEDDGMLEAIPECKAFVERNKHRFEGKDFTHIKFQLAYSKNPPTM